MVFGTLTPAGLTQASGETATGSQQDHHQCDDPVHGIDADQFIAGRAIATPGSAAQRFAEENDYSAYAAGRKRSGSGPTPYAAVYRKAPVMADAFNQRWSVWACGHMAVRRPRRQCGAVARTHDQQHRRRGGRRRTIRFSPFHYCRFCIWRPAEPVQRAKWDWEATLDLFQGPAPFVPTPSPGLYLVRRPA